MAKNSYYPPARGVLPGDPILLACFLLLVAPNALLFAFANRNEVLGYELLGMKEVPLISGTAHVAALWFLLGAGATACLFCPPMLRFVILALCVQFLLLGLYWGAFAMLLIALLDHSRRPKEHGDSLANSKEVQ